MRNKQRIFAGIPLPDGIRDSFTQFQLAQKYHALMRWVPVDNLHITTCFIGDMELSEINDLKEKLANNLSLINPFNLDFNKLLMAPRKKPYMLWATYHTNQEFVQLAKTISHSAGIQAGEHLIPHITLARYKQGLNVDFIHLDYPVAQKKLEVAQVNLYESILKPDGAEYHIIEKYVFNK